METERKIKVYCPEHQATCEVTAKPHIVCTIEEHALSNDFPQGEFWEFCADCQTFLPTRLAVGVRAAAVCPNCSREPARHFLCEHCHIETFESDEPARGKTYHLKAEKGIEPNCPGCQIPAENKNINTHSCPQIEARILTSRSICPFCLEPVIKANDVSNGLSNKNRVSQEPGKCSQCGALNPPHAVFCGKCQNQIRDDIFLSNRGSSENRSQLLGSLCPNCSTPVPPDSDFCGECGQAVKKAVVPPPPPPPKNMSAETTAIFETVSPVNSGASDNFKKLAIGAGGLVMVLIFIGFVSNMTKSSPSSSTTMTSSNYKKNSNPNSFYNSNQKSDSNSGSEDGFSVVGKYGYITINVNLRNGPDRRYEDIGTLFQETKIKILQVAHRDDSSDWWEVEVESLNDYGCSSVDPNRCGKDEPDDASQGWINSKFVAFH